MGRKIKPSRRFEVTLEGGRVLILYGKDEADVRGRVPTEITKPPAFAVMMPTPAVVSVVERSGEQAKLVTDVRKAPGT